MSDAPQHAGPDLHAIFGIDGDPAEGPEPVISFQRSGLGDADPDVEPNVEIAAEVESDQESPQATGECNVAEGIGCEHLVAKDDEVNGSVIW